MKLSWCLLPIFLTTTCVSAADRNLVVHCFAFTKAPTAVEADWERFRSLTAALPQKIAGLTRAVHGPLRRPMGQMEMTSRPSEQDLKKFVAGQEIDVKVVNSDRQYGVCMDFESEAAFLAYGKSPVHADWEAAYKKVRVPGTTTFQILTQ